MSLYFALLPSDLSLELIQYLDPVLLINLIEVLEQYPNIYARSFPLDKLERLFKTYIASQPPDLSGKTDMQKITSYLDAYTEYKLLFYMPTPTKDVYKVIREKLRNIINNDWDIALVTFLDYINKDLKNNREFYRLIGFAYTEAIEKGRLHLIEILYQKY